MTKNTDIIKLVPKDQGKPTVNSDLVELLEDLLKQAKSGDIQGISYAAINDGRVFWGWSTEHGADMVGAIEILKKRYVEDLLT